MIKVGLISSVFTVTLFLIYSSEGKPAEIYHHYVQRADCDHLDETDINLSQMVVKEYNVEETDTFDVNNCPKCSIDEDYQRGSHGGYISCKCSRNMAGLVHGDIKIDDRNRGYMNQVFGLPTFQRATISGTDMEWPRNSQNNVIIPYLSSAKVLRDSEVSARFQRALKAFHDNTCVRFVPRTNQEDYLLPVDGGGCWAYIGRIGGEQKVSVGKACGKDGIVVHELMHCLGFFHEQSRKDRDRYITIRMRSVLQGFESNFKIAKNIEDTTSPYDYESVMHYGSHSFSTDGQPTIIRNDGGSTLRMGQRDGMTAIDIKEINDKYCRGRVAATAQPVLTTTRSSIVRTTTAAPSTTTRSTTTVPSVTNCVDEQTQKNCENWEKMGYCRHTYRDFMRRYCKSTCGVCTNGIASTKSPKIKSACKDLLSICPQYTKYCNQAAYKAWMRGYCSHSCGFCVSSEIQTTTVATTTEAPRRISNAACGTVYSNSLYARIVGGRDADAGSIPWQANLRFKGLSVCGGTLIGDSWILTAAHCMIGGPEDYTVLLGLQDRDLVDQPQVQEFGVRTIILHDEYSPMSSSGPMINDIALVELDRSVEYTNYVIKACLPPSNWGSKFNQFTASGWGDTTESGVHSQTLQKVTLSRIDKRDCTNWLGQSGFSIDPNAICAGDVEGGKDSCQGDSGGPLTAQHYSKTYVMAVVSWGVGCGREKHPGIYTEVTSHRVWIKKKTGL